MNYEEFFDLAASRGLRVSNDLASNESEVYLSNEALFQLPFLAMVIMVLAKGQRKPVPEELGQLVGECLEKTVAGFKGSPQGIGWSANLRIRTVKALTFLEAANLVLVHPRTRSIALTELGRRIIETVFASDSQLSVHLATVERGYQNISAEKAIQRRLV